MLIDVLDEVDSARSDFLILTEESKFTNVGQEGLGASIKLEGRAHGEPISELWFDQGLINGLFLGLDRLAVTSPLDIEVLWLSDGHMS